MHQFEEEIYGSQVDRLDQLEDFAFEAYLDFVDKASRAFSLANSRQDIDFKESDIETVELSGDWRGQYSLEEQLQEAREAGERFSDFFRLLEEEVSIDGSDTYTASEAVKVNELYENFNRLDSKYRSAVTQLETIQQQLGPKRKHERPEFSFEEISYQELMDMGSTSAEEVMNRN